MSCSLVVAAAASSIAAAVSAFVWFLLRDTDSVLAFYRFFGRSDDVLGGKVAWITGAAHGIGKNLAVRWASKGVKLILTDLDATALEKAKQACLECSKGVLKEEDVLILPGDLTTYGNHQKWLLSILEHFGRLDILVNNAGRFVQGSFDSVPVEVAKAQFDINVFAHVALTQTVLPHFRERKYGHVVTTCSVGGRAPLPRLTTYSASKAALTTYFSCLRMEAAADNIDVTTVCPGPIKTELLDKGGIGGRFDFYMSQYPWFFNEMSAERCAELMSWAVANKLGEVWISKQPIMAAIYIYQILPGPMEWFTHKFIIPFLDSWVRRRNEQHSKND